MSRRNLGIGIMGIGLAMIVIGVLSLGDSSETTAQADPAVTATVPPTAAPTSAAPTTAAPTTTAPVTTTPATTTAAPPATTVAPTTTTTATTTTTSPPSVEDFILAYAAATASGDADFLFDSLLPDIREVLGVDTCRNWVETEILALSDYTVTGDVSGPIARTLTIGETTITVDQYYEAPVRFTFQGQSFDTLATFVIRDGQVFWIGACR